MAKAGTSPNLRLFILWSARLALMAFVFQTAAIDHWRPDPEHRFNGGALHAAHCHGNASQCADSSSLVGTLDLVALTPLPPSAIRSVETPSALRPPEALALGNDEPPRSA